MPGLGMGVLLRLRTERVPGSLSRSPRHSYVLEGWHRTWLSCQHLALKVGAVLQPRKAPGTLPCWLSC